MDTATAKTRITARIAELNARLHVFEHELDAARPKDWEDAATERESDEVLEQLGSSGQAEIVLLEAALRRIEDGSYGICSTCGADILPERLEAVPYAVLCRKCAGAGPH